MIVEVTGTNTWNKGAELMMVAIRRYVDAHQPDVQLAVDSTFGSYVDRARYRLWHRPRRKKWRRSGIALRIMGPGFRRSLGIVSDDEISAVLDASGFAFGDRLGAKRTLRFAEDVEVARRAGKKIVMLPQALGPFEIPEIRGAFARIVNACDRVYARDPLSFEYARAAARNDERIHLAPDFTNLVECPPADWAENGRRACIVPNQRMIEHARDSKAAGLYLPMLNQCIAATRHAGLEPFVLVHGKDDIALAEALQQESRQLLEIIHESDPVRIKQVIGSSDLVIASRFHALVSALSQCVPAIGTSWSHKYEMLFGDYECEQFLLPVGVDKDQIFDRVGLATGSERAELVGKLRDNGQRMAEQTRRMWEDVASIVFRKTLPD